MEGIEVVCAFFQDLPVPDLSFGKLTEALACQRPREQGRDVVMLPNCGRRAENPLSSRVHPMVSSCRGDMGIKPPVRVGADGPAVGRSLGETRKETVNYVPDGGEGASGAQAVACAAPCEAGLAVSPQ
jgi:hypothetical protein